MIPAVLYGAKSSPDPRASIPNQLRDTRTAADREGRNIIAEYSDEAASAYKGNRGAGLTAAKEHALRLAAEHGTCEFWIQHSDRVARGDGITADHLAEVWFALRRGHVRMRSVDDDHNLEDAIRVVLIGERNHEDSARKGAATARGHRRRRVERGLHTGAPMKYGYRHVRDEYGRTNPGPMVIDPPAARVVSRLFDDALAGVALAQTCRDLGNEGVPTPRGGRRWYASTIRSILIDPYYAGYIRDDTFYAGAGAPRGSGGWDGTGLVKGKHEPIVTIEQWQAVHEVIARRRATGDGQGGRTSKHPTLFTHGHLRCGLCGSPMGIRNDTRGNRRPKYVCTLRRHDATACAMAPIDAEDIETMMLDQLKDQPGQLTAAVRAAVVALLSDRETTADQLRAAERQLADLDAQAERVERDYRAGDLSAKNWERLSETIAEEKTAAQAQADRLAKRATELASTLADDEAEAAVARVLSRVADVLADASRIETARNVIRQAWPVIVAHRDGDTVRLEVPEISKDFGERLPMLLGAQS